MSDVYAIRTIASPSDFTVPGAPDIEQTLTAMIEGGETKPAWCFVIARDGRDVGRLGLRVDGTCPAEWLGDLPAREVFVFGLALPWSDAEHVAIGRALLAHARAATREALPEMVQAVVNRERDDHAPERVALYAALGATLFQEKAGFAWSRGAEPPAPPSGRLAFESLAQSGEDVYRRTLGAVGASTLDRNDAWYRDLAGEENWSRVFMSFCGPEDAKSWLLARLPTGEAVGIVAVGPLDEATATVVFIGVVPQHRGHGYIDDLVRAGTCAAEARGYRAMLSDVDVMNRPMAAAFTRNRHLDGARSWHKWHFRFEGAGDRGAR